MARHCILGVLARYELHRAPGGFSSASTGKGLACICGVQFSDEGGRRGTTQRSGKSFAEVVGTTRLLAECNPLSMEEMVGCATSRLMGKDGFSAATALGQKLKDQGSSSFVFCVVEGNEEEKWLDVVSNCVKLRPWRSQLEIIKKEVN